VDGDESVDCGPATSMRRIGEQVIWQVRESIAAWRALWLREMAAVHGAATDL
jgi:hypothetical protein